MVKFCPECGGELKFDNSTKNMICKSCGIFASREKIDELSELRDRSNSDVNSRKRMHDDYLDWWQSSKKDKQRQY